MDDGKRSVGRPRNTFKRDYIVFLGGGMGSGAPLTITGKTKHSFWIDHNPFATVIRRLVTKNVSFEIWKLATPIGGGLYTEVPGSEADLYVAFDQSNDRPDEMFTDSGELASGRVVKVPPSIPPPYFFDTTTIKQPTDPKYITDQGNFVYYSYDGSGQGVARTGVNDFQAQSFIPTSPLLTSLFLRDLFHVGTSTDPTLYRDITVELWDSNRNFYANVGIIPKTGPIDQYTDANGNLITTVSDSWIVGTDSVQYWVEIQEVRFVPAQPIKLVPGQTYYIIIRHATPTASYLYAVGSNSASGGGYNGKGRYIYGGAYSGTGVAGANSITAAPANVSLCFSTQRNIGRTAATFYWGNAGYFWVDPDQFKGQFIFVKEDFDQAEI